ncbi:hypothetical protein QBC37DRAFT_196209 [Rhypophila decipiens]|uniref:Uncharacterized protein n=1 Tax=Rhypophila decipiens TaxID=261697 RepID=A0AAN6Y6G7_9PEZI|nr:hypothetical protein QBC37DRAFT_196209 [Rhypophila decipiens]
MDLWDVFYSAVGDDNGEDEEPETRLHLKLIEQTQQQYMRLFANQAALLEGSDGEGQFVSRLAAVIASLPSIRSLTFDDKPSPRQQKNPMCERLPTISPYECDVSDLNTILYEDILTPGHGRQDVVSGWVVPQLLGDLVEARRRLGCHRQRRPLEALHISLDHVEDLFPTPAPAFADSIASELSQLKVFCASFRAKRLGPGRIRDYSNMPNTDPDANFQAWQPENVNNPLNQRLKLAIASRRLERCTVACRNVDDSFDWKHHPYIGTALKCRNIPFTHLRQLQLTAVRFHQAELVAFLETCFVSPLCKDGRPEKKGDYYTARVELAQVYLCSGTWQETRQALRRASQRTGPRAFFSVDDPQGADTHEQQYKSTLFKKLLVAWPPLRFLNRQRSRESVLQARLGSTDE